MSEDALKAQKKDRDPRLRSQVPQVLPWLARASNRPRISRTVVAAAMTKTKEETRVDQALEVEAAKVIDS